MLIVKVSTGWYEHPFDDCYEGSVRFQHGFRARGDRTYSDRLRYGRLDHRVSAVRLPWSEFRKIYPDWHYGLNA